MPATCYISSGIAQGLCDVSTGGIKKIYVIGGGGSVTGVTYDSNDQITGATSSGTTVLYGFNLKRGVSSLTQTVNKSYENGTLYFQQDLLITLYKYDYEKRNLLLLLAQNDELQIVAVDQNDTQYWLGAVNGMAIASGTATSGLALADRNGFEITFSGQEPEPSYVIDGTLATVFAPPITIEE